MPGISLHSSISELSNHRVTHFKSENKTGLFVLIKICTDSDSISLFGFKNLIEFYILAISWFGIFCFNLSILHQYEFSLPRHPRPSFLNPCLQMHL